MYFDQFESWGSAVDQAASFVVKATVRTGVSTTSVIATSPIPVSHIHAVAAQITDALDTKTSWTQWDRTKKEIVMIPYESIVSLTVSLVD